MNELNDLCHNALSERRLELHIETSATMILLNNNAQSRFSFCLFFLHYVSQFSFWERFATWFQRMTKIGSLTLIVCRNKHFELNCRHLLQCDDHSCSDAALRHRLDLLVATHQISGAVDSSTIVTFFSCSLKNSVRFCHTFATHLIWTKCPHHSLQNRHHKSFWNSTYASAKKSRTLFENDEIHCWFFHQI